MPSFTCSLCVYFLYSSPMKIFALETNEQKLIKSFLSHGEEVILRVKFSSFLFILRTFKAILFTLIFVAVDVGLTSVGFPLVWDSLILFVFWLFFVFFRWLTAFIDWKFDVLLVTSEEVVVVDQSSLFHAHIRQMNLDNIASVSAETQFWNLFPFGKLHFDLKEGTGRALVLPYIPLATKVASVISDTIVAYQRRRTAVAHAALHGASPAQAEKIVTDEGMAGRG